MCTLSSSPPSPRRDPRFETRSLPTLTRSYPRRFTFYVADPCQLHSRIRRPASLVALTLSPTPAVKFGRPCQTLDDVVDLHFHGTLPEVLATPIPNVQFGQPRLTPETILSNSCIES